MTDAELLAALKAQPQSGLGVPRGRARFRRPDHDLALAINLDAFVEQNGGEIVTIRHPESRGLRPARLFKAPRPREQFYDVPAALVSGP